MKMGREDYLLTCLIEEAAELQKNIIKSNRFGLDNIYMGFTNKEKIQEEVSDLLGVAQMLFVEGYLRPPSTEELNAKKDKINDMYHQHLTKGLDDTCDKEYEFTVSSDIGSVLIGTKDFGFAIPNGYGDGDTIVHVLEYTDRQKGNEIEQEIRDDGFQFQTSFSVTPSETHIYSHDTSDRCEETIMHTFNGQKYGVYVKSRHVIFSRWE